MKKLDVSSQQKLFWLTSGRNTASAIRNEADGTPPEKAERQLHAAADWYAEQNPQVADDWFAAISAAILDLDESAERFGVARENDQLPFELRERRFGLGKRITHRILFVIRDKTVLVHQIRHVAQRDITEEE